jgi:AcrR family transcriptional regulator
MSTTGRERGSYAKSAERRREILAAGIEVFSASGYRSGSIREIAARVGMSQAGLLHHFSSKSELLAAVLQYRDDEDRLRMHIESEQGLGVIQGLVGLAEHNAAVPGLVELHCVLSAEATAADHPAHGYFVNRYRQVHEVTTRALHEMGAEGQIADGVHEESVARTLIALMDGLQVQWLLERDSVDMAEEVRSYLRPLLTVPL